MYCKKCGAIIENIDRFCRFCGQRSSNSNFSIFKNKLLIYFHKNKTIFIVTVVVVLLIFSGFLSSPTIQSPVPSQSSKQTKQSLQKDANENLYEEDVISDNIPTKEKSTPVVNILCPSTMKNDDSSGGSGVIIGKKGLIITNSHIIPQDSSYIHVDDQGCLITLPDPVTGQVKEIYLAQPIVLPKISEKYDLAYMSIYAAYFDKEKQKYFGTYPRDFPIHEDSNECVSEQIRLGESIRIYGYPAISGGYSLTITEGIVSSFPGEGLIVTSAKISHRNSGGLAVNSRGCMVGIPSMVSSDENESLGLIISRDLINEFHTEVNKYLDEYKE